MPDRGGSKLVQIKPPPFQVSPEAPKPSDNLTPTSEPLPLPPAVPYPGRGATDKELDAWHKAMQDRIEKK